MAMLKTSISYKGKNILDVITSIASTLGNMAVPPACIACGRTVGRQGGLCQRCWQGTHFIDRPYCEVMGTPFPFDHGEGAISPEAMADPPPFDRLRSAVLYGDCPRRLVSRLKFSDQPELARWISGWMRVAGGDLLRDCDVAIPVPLHWRRLHMRRYNQSAELARWLCRSSDIEYQGETLVRLKKTRQQVGLNSQERERNVQGAFRVEKDKRPLVEGRRILLIDDVYTSGATAKACARALRRAGASGIDVLTFARVSSGDI
ncbi:MAG: ComF family protein [Nitratireductor sp.]